MSSDGIISLADWTKINMSNCKNYRETSEIATKALFNARHYVSHRNYGLAFANFLLVGKLEPSMRNEIEADFILSTREWTEELIKTDRIEHLFACYSQACQTFPDCGTLLNNIGAQLFRLGYVEDAVEYIRKALRLDPESTGAKDNFENICGHLVERWHFRMLNDVCRNQAYKSAIQRSIVNGWSSVLDIGTGTGLLSMFAVDAGARSVYACEMSKTMCTIARDVLSLNRKDGYVQLINKASTDLSIPEDLPSRVSLIVTETFDAGLFGEHILSTLNHAWEHLLKEGDNYDNTQVIPSNAQVFVCGIESESIRNQNRFGYPCVPGVDCSLVELVSNTGIVENEPYTTENLTSIRGGFKQITEPTQLLSVNFNDPRNIASLLEGASDIVSCPIILSGRLDALAVWFDLHLDDVTTLSTSPANENCWHQAIYPVFSSHLYPNQGCEQSVYIHKGDNLMVKYVCQADKLEVKCSLIEEKVTEFGVSEKKNVSLPVISEEIVCETSPPVTGGLLSRKQPVHPELVTSSKSDRSACAPEQIHVQSRSTCGQDSVSDFKNFSLDSCDERLTTETASGCNRKSKFQLSRSKIGMLNDMSLNRAVYQALEQTLKTLRPDSSPSTPLTLLDMSHGFSCVALQAVELGFSTVRLFSQSDHCKGTDILNKLSQDNGINSNCFKTQLSYMESGKEEDKVQCIFVDLIEPSGVLYQQVLEDLALLKVTCLERDGFILPASACVYGLLIESHELEASSRVIGDQITLGYHIKNIMNEFQMSTHMDIDLSVLSHRRLSQPFLMVNLDFNERNQSSQACTDPLDHLPSFLTADTDIPVVVTETGDLTAIVFWFDIHYTDHIQLSTLNSCTHWKQAAIVLDHNMALQADQLLHLNVSLKNSSLRIKPQLRETGNQNGDASLSNS